METLLIHKNTKKLRGELEKMGYELCSCIPDVNDSWLFTIHGRVHALYDEEKEIALLEIKEGKADCIDCGNDEKMFLKLAKNEKNTVK